MSPLAAANSTIVGQPGGGFAAVKPLMKVNNEAAETLMSGLGRSS
jgi:hypothetical protein